MTLKVDELDKLKQSDRIEYLLRLERLEKQRPQKAITISTIGSLLGQALLIILLLTILVFSAPSESKYTLAKAALLVIQFIKTFFLVYIIGYFIVSAFHLKSLYKHFNILEALDAKFSTTKHGRNKI